MQLSTRNIHVIYVILVLTCIDAATLKKNTKKCPLGFQLAYTDSGSGICYRQKPPEAFYDKYKDCTGNLYSSKLYHSLNFPKNNKVLWTDYRSLYPGGPFIDWWHPESIESLLQTMNDVKYDAALGLEEELCVVIDPVSNFTAARCDEKHDRYCFVKPYPEEDDISTKGCQKGSWRFYSPYSTCLTPVTGVGGGTVRATWRQALELCSKRGLSLLSKGWRYSNCPVLHTSGALPYYPLGLVKQENLIYQYDSENETSEVPMGAWNFEDLSELRQRDWVFGAVRDEFWHLVNSSYVFFDVICEQRVPLRNIELKLTVDGENNLLLRVNNTINKGIIKCFTDSLDGYSASNDGVFRVRDDDQVFQVFPDRDGYYYCIQTDYKNYHLSESNKELYIRSKDEVANLYAVRLRLRKEYRFQNMDKLKHAWEKKLQEYIYYWTKYISVFRELPANGTEEILQAFKKSRPHLDYKAADVTYDLSIKRLFLDNRTALVHVMLNPTMLPVTPGTWGALEVVYMKPAYYCPEWDTIGIPRTPLGESATSAGCRTFSCVGDFNNGVQWVETATADCTTQFKPFVEVKVANFTDMATEDTFTVTTTDPLLMTTLEGRIVPHAWVNFPPPNVTQPSNTTKHDSSSTEEEDYDFNTTTETEWLFTTVNPPPPPFTTTEEPIDTTTDPTTTVEATTIQPDEQLQQVLTELQSLLDNDMVPLESIEKPFDRVNDILDVQDSELVIPGELLHMLDKLAARVQLSAGQGIAVRPNVAIMMADSTPDAPIRGVRVAASATDDFSNSTFGFIDGVLDTSQLLTNESEAVVYLPASVTTEPRRVSFVAFRNQRAFASELPVNSRVFSVNVENVTEFESGEVIDIHLTPFVGEPDRNQSRVCAYWQFTENSTDAGYWSQDGCTLIRATAPGAMDTCRCTHLTHFAEVLVPRAVFSEADERALEVLSVVGCALSMLGLALIALTAAVFRSWRRDYSNKIWLQLCVAVFVLVLCFLVIVFVSFERSSVPCMLVGVALHYSVLASFCWMLVAAVLSYRRLVLVFTRDMSHKLLRASAFAWGAPCAVVGVLLSVDPRSYQGRFDELTPSGTFCYPSGLGIWLAVYAPIALMLLANWILFALIVRSVFASRRIQRHGDSNEALRCASVSCLLVFLFGLPWIFGLFAFNVVLAYLFTLTATFQGFVLFIFFVLGNKKTRDLWLNKLKIKQTRKVPVTSSTYTNRSTGPGWRGGVEGATTIEAKTSKPRSLASPDDSRFS